MYSYKSIRTLKCDHCGNELVMNITDKDEFEPPMREAWTNLMIDSSVVVNNRVIPFHQHIDICPECAKEFLEYLKENYDHNATWKPVDLTVPELNLGCINDERGCN